MSVVGIALVLDPADDTVTERVRRLPGLTLGPRRGARLAAVLEVAEESVRGSLEAIAALPGVLSVAPVFHAPTDVENERKADPCP